MQPSCSLLWYCLAIKKCLDRHMKSLVRWEVEIMSPAFAGSMPITTATWSSMSESQIPCPLECHRLTPPRHPHPWAAADHTHSLRGQWCAPRWQLVHSPSVCSTVGKTCICSVLPDTGGAAYCCQQRCWGSSENLVPLCHLLNKKRKNSIPSVQSKLII